MDMKSTNPNMKDFVAYRIKYLPHPRTNNKWCIYPSYDFTHCIVDSLEHIDYSCCTLEFETRRESYFWLLEQLDLYRPYVWEFSRLNVSGSLLSKRKINALIENKTVRGFDDPRLMTLAGMRRRGYTPESINQFCNQVGTTRTNNLIDIKMLEATLRECLDNSSSRKLGVMDPVKVTLQPIVNLPDSDDILSHNANITAPNHPKYPEMGTRKLNFSRTLYIDRSDFRETGDNSKFYGVVIGRPVGLKYAGNIIAREFIRNSANKIVEIVCEYDPYRSVKPKTNIGWVDAHSATPVEFRLYESLCLPSGVDSAEPTDSVNDNQINPNSEVIQFGFLEQCTAMPTRHTVQIERLGYYTVDDDTCANSLVMNRILPLRQSKD